MARLEQLRRRIETAKELRSVVTTMKSLAAAKIREFEQAADSLAEYAETVELGFRILLRLHPDEFERIPGRVEAPNSLAPNTLVIIGADRGMVGRFDEELVEHVEARFGSLAGGERRVIVLGSRLVSELEARGVEVDAALELPGDAEAIVDRVVELLVALDEGIREQDTPRVIVAHHRRAEAAIHRPSDRLLTPIDPGWLAELRERGWPERGIPASSLPPAELAQALVRQHLLSSLQRTLAESLAAENARRLTAMQAAERNVDERLEQLEADHRRERQTLITAELLEVSAGFEVLAREDDRSSRS